MNKRQKWVKEAGKWYYYRSDKKMTSSWVKSNDRWYYLDKDGSMAKGWFQTAKDNSWYYAFSEECINEGKKFYEGEICTGWLQLKEKWYYFEEYDENTLGKMYCSGIFIIHSKKQKFDNNGVWIGEVKENNSLQSTSSGNGISDSLCSFIAAFEGCYLNAYYCPSGVLTIGIGCTRKEITSLKIISKERAYTEFKKDAAKFANGVDNLCKESNVTLKDHERDALISFAFNTGIEALKGSTLWKNIKNGIRNKDIITENFLRWVKDNKGNTLQGLVRRRRAEAVLFLDGKIL